MTTLFDDVNTSDPKFKAALSVVVDAARQPFDSVGPARDWTHAAARGIAAELVARPEIAGMTEDERCELISSLALIVKAAGWAWFCAPSNEFF